jgi:hypothetical protein
MDQQQQNAGAAQGQAQGQQPQGVNAPNAAQALNQAAAITGKVSVVYGANDLEMELGGHTVADVQASLADVLNLDKNAEAYVNGLQVKGDYQLKAGDRLEFMKEAGQKG